MKILCLIDSPTLATGFARVGQNLLPAWAAAGHEVHVWGIGFAGWGYEDWPNLKLFPANNGGPWNSAAGLEQFLRVLNTGGYTHCFILQDTFQFGMKFSDTFTRVCRAKGIRSVMYFPCEAALEPEWVNILAAVDVAVAYTEFGRRQALAAAAKADMRLNVEVIPHGVDGEIYRGDLAARAHDREIWQVNSAVPNQMINFLAPGDFCLLNVNTNQWRKDPARTLELLAALLQRGVPAKLVMHCRADTGLTGVDLEAVGRQFGLQLWKDWIHTNSLFGAGDSTFMGYDRNGRALVGSLVSQPDLARFYNAADCVVSTTLGEGWGFSITEALSCGCPVAMPEHTSCAEIRANLIALDTAYVDRQWCPLPAPDRIVMAGEVSRVRWRVDVEAAADRLAEYWRSGKWQERRALPAAAREWLSWPAIAGQFLQLLAGDGAPAPVAQPETQTLEVTV